MREQYQSPNCPNQEPLSFDESRCPQWRRGTTIFECYVRKNVNEIAAQILDVLQSVARRAGFDLPPEAGEQIAEDSGGNLRKAILTLEALKMQS